MSKIYWLASYPKSGNTWLRAFLTNYWRDGDEPADINQIWAGQIVFNRSLFDEYLGFHSADLSPAEIEHYQPLVYEQMAASSPDPLFVKNHSAFLYNAAGQPLFPKAVTAGVIYVIRNPLDVAVSFAHHDSNPIDVMIERMGCDGTTLWRASETVHPVLPQRLLSWSHHVSSWLDEAGLNLLVVRYEDLLQRPVKVFGEIIRFAGLELERARLEKAIDFSRFDRLQQQEATHGFAQKQPTAKSFFRRGRADSWRESLTRTQIQRLIDDHGPVMQRFGYLTADRHVVETGNENLIARASTQYRTAGSAARGTDSPATYSRRG